MATQDMGLYSLPMNQGQTVADEEHERPQMLQFENDKKLDKQICSNWALVCLLVISSLLLVVITFGVSILAFQAMKEKPEASEIFKGNNENSLQPSHYQYLPITALNELPLEQIEKMESLTLQWGRTGSHEEIKYYFQIEFAVQDRKKDQTTLGLSFGHKLVATSGNATLISPNGEELGVIQFFPPDEPHDFVDADVTQFLQRVSVNETRVIDDKNLLFPTEDNVPRKLAGKGKYGRYPYNVDQGLPESFFDAYCRYGCGGMAVTFPYYYRPFFGYGFPLVGTEALFPQGYGGYPAAQILASQAGINNIQGTSSPSVSPNSDSGAMLPPRNGASNGATSSGSVSIPNVGGILPGGAGALAGALGGLPTSLPIP
ncbi:hypothetical protein IE077_004014 [Cardiosporidium cionae]|uniref:Uncharacterized protein n=1 Tax=Cardiosporidium cionae TaxID=476202 RepID=A0ABQ7J704_9APIC|nr:hypothetical protein IE077_004014 [Cardiosporidium cionae]|eukprot:KAF8819782.1 hypothetical protein IE077_004014 [Cardiosporidium cionae]